MCVYVCVLRQNHPLWPWWLWTYRDPSASALWVLRLKVCITMPDLQFIKLIIHKTSKCNGFFFKYLFCVYNTCDKQFFFPYVIVSSIEFRLYFHIFLFVGITFLILIEQLTVHLLFSFPPFLTGPCSVALACLVFTVAQGGIRILAVLLFSCFSAAIAAVHVWLSVVIFSQTKKNLHQNASKSKVKHKNDIEEGRSHCCVPLCVQPSS